jgi:triacylglycerol lipase
MNLMLVANLAPPAARTAGEWWSTRDADAWPAPPPGAGRPAMLIPGFLAGDLSLRRMFTWLQSGGFVCAPSGMRWNVDCMERVAQSLEARLEEAVQREGQRALVVGQSRGGTLGRVLAVRRPDLVETLIALGSPVRDQLAVRPQVWLSIGAVGGLGTLGVPGLFSASCRNGSCCVEARGQLGEPFPDSVRFIAVYSRRDEVVKWEACLDPDAEHIEVETTHIGMGLDATVWDRLAAALAV